MSASNPSSLVYTDLTSAQVAYLQRVVPVDADRSGLAATIQVTPQTDGKMTASIHYTAKPPPHAEVAVSANGGQYNQQYGTTFASLVSNGFYSAHPEDMTVHRSIRTNNPGAINISEWQKARHGYVGFTLPDNWGNKTTIYRTPEHGVAAWYHLITDIYAFGNGAFTLQMLARSYAGSGASDARLQTYINGWVQRSNGQLTPTISISANDLAMMRSLARAMFSLEAGQETPLSDAQVAYGIEQERAGTLPA
jgi:hypothetical protein